MEVKFSSQGTTVQACVLFFYFTVEAGSCKILVNHAATAHLIVRNQIDHENSKARTKCANKVYKHTVAIRDAMKI